MLGFVWFVCVPAIFAFFYTVIETQSAARVAVGANSRLAPFTISRLADRLDALEAEIARASAELTALDEKIRASQEKVDSAKHKSTAAINSVWITLHNTQPTCDPIEKCLDDIVTENEQRSWPDGAEIPKRVALAQELYEDYRGALFITNDLQDRNGHAEAALAAAKAEYLGTQAPAAAGRPDPKADDASDGDAVLEAASLGDGSIDDQKAVALSYNKQRAIPLFEFAFFLPSGVIVASFTGLMGAIGAAVYSLYIELGVLAAPRRAPASDRTWMAFGVRPLLGALAGFTVFFVISAGASFLIQPQAAEATQAVNQLSPPALASLGLFAGLASERALKWLIEKANSFFKSSGEDGAAAG
ncbi:hypothetical protein ASD38_10940 [Caulobacter sp. Root487D2Y]|nr:hypothetical protein ASD38_10940 [Caulobacter sp. Root487D2Y]